MLKSSPVISRCERSKGMGVLVGAGVKLGVRVLVGRSLYEVSDVMFWGGLVIAAEVINGFAVWILENELQATQNKNSRTAALCLKLDIRFPFRSMRG